MGAQHAYAINGTSLSVFGSRSVALDSDWQKMSSEKEIACPLCSRDSSFFAKRVCHPHRQVSVGFCSLDGILST